VAAQSSSGPVVVVVVVVVVVLVLLLSYDDDDCVVVTAVAVCCGQPIAIVETVSTLGVLRCSDVASATFRASAPLLHAPDGGGGGGGPNTAFDGMDLTTFTSIIVRAFQKAIVTMLRYSSRAVQKWMNRSRCQLHF